MLHENPIFHHNIESHEIDETWVDFLADCGGEKVLENQVHTKVVFNDRYENNIVTWTGYFAEAKPK